MSVVADHVLEEEQENVIEEVAEAAAEKEGLETEEKPKEEMAATEEKPTEEMAEAPTEPTAEAPKEEGGEDRVAKLEKAQEQLMEEIAKLKSEIEKPKEEEVEVVMSDNRPVWKRISDGINVINKSK